MSDYTPLKPIAGSNSYIADFDTFFTDLSTDMTSVEGRALSLEGRALSLEGRATNIELKTDFISVSQSVNLDTMESDIAINNTKVSNITHSGDVSGSSVLTINNNVVTNAKAADMAQSTIKGRAAGAGTGDPVDLTGAQALLAMGISATPTELNKIDGDTSASTITATGTDRVIYNDGGVMKQIALTTLSAYFRSVAETLSNKTLDQPTIISTDYKKVRTGRFNGITGATLWSVGGFSVSRTTSGTYLITHNIGNTHYTPMLSVSASNTAITYNSIGNNTFGVTTQIVSTGAISDCTEFGVEIIIDP